MENILYVMGPLADEVLDWILNEASRRVRKPRLEVMFEREGPCLFLGRVFLYLFKDFLWFLLVLRVYG